MKTDPELWDANLDWLLNCSSSALGQRGTTAAVIAAIERGGASGSGDHEEVMLTRISYLKADGAVARQRRLLARWLKLEPKHGAVLALHYQPRRAGDKMDQHIGFCSKVALHLAPNVGALLQACEQVTRGGAADIRAAARNRAERAVKAAHRAWQQTGQRQALEWYEAAE